MKTLKEMKQEIKNHMENIPGNEFSTGLIFQKIGYKYVTYLNIWDGTTVEKKEISEFYSEYIRK